MSELCKHCGKIESRHCRHYTAHRLIGACPVFNALGEWIDWHPTNRFTPETGEKADYATTAPPMTDEQAKQLYGIGEVIQEIHSLRGELKQLRQDFEQHKACRPYRRLK